MLNKKAALAEPVLLPQSLALTHAGLFDRFSVPPLQDAKTTAINAAVSIAFACRPMLQPFSTGMINSRHRPLPRTGFQPVFKAHSERRSNA